MDSHGSPIVYHRRTPIDGPLMVMEQAQRQKLGRRGQGASTPTILSHLLTLPAQTLIRLFSYPSNALAIFRLLPPLARHLILTCLFLPDPPKLSVEDVNTLFSRDTSLKEEADGEHTNRSSSRRNRSQRGLAASKEVLNRLGIVRESNDVLYLNGKWAEALRRALMGGGDHKSFGVPSTTALNDRLTAAQLDAYALQSWESILLYMVATDDVRTPSQPVLYLLRSAGLMQSSAGSRTLERMTITSKGFQFLLDDAPTQLWMLLHAYLLSMSDSSESQQGNVTADIVEHLTFLFTLGSATLGQDYDISALTQSQMDMLDFFTDLGLVYRKSPKSQSFYPTRLITTLTNAGQLPLLMGGRDGDGADGEETNEEDKGFVILETNYKVYAYTNNLLRINVLGQFVHIRARFPNLVTGVITRDSVKEALTRGIGAEQIIMYLTHHAHPQMYKNDPLLPVTVTDQIRLWEREKHRVQPEEGAMLSHFSSGADFNLVREYAEQMGSLLWSDANTRRMFIISDGLQPVSDFIKRRLH